MFVRNVATLLRHGMMVIHITLTRQGRSNTLTTLTMRDYLDVLAIDRPHICLSCGEGFNVDSRAPISVCQKCKSHDLVDTFQLDGQRCPHCKVGMFAVDPSFFTIS